APIWEGNLVWLVTLGGALFAAFPGAYATILSGFYLIFIAILLGLIFRAISIHLRNKEGWKWWKKGWDVAFSLSSTAVSFLFGLVLGNLAQGIPLDSSHDFIGTFGSLFNPYSILTGLTIVSLFSMHGTLYLLLKAKDPLHNKIRSWAKYTISLFVLTFLATIIFTYLQIPSSLEAFIGSPWHFIPLTLTLFATIFIVREFRLKRDGMAFASSCFVILTLTATYALGTYPYLVFSSPTTENSLTIYNAASSSKTLGILLVIALIGMPLVIIYSIAIYRVFRKKADSTPY
ncbi:MAG TPA: cytochrome d ubiquinol oxidase subunit II, partial [Bdellovibrionota bacterium]|nr:cytochrome d ubiquinol oxidase subunit II [Bdellovibrionota bacterium]